MVRGADIPGRADRTGTGSENLAASKARGIAGALRGKEAVDAERHPDGWMRARARRLIRKAKAAGNDGAGSQSIAGGRRGQVPPGPAGGA